ncbi:hypothetical protein D3C78_1299570 [compost metagenome]
MEWKPVGDGYPLLGLAKRSKAQLLYSVVLQGLLLRNILPDAVGLRRETKLERVMLIDRFGYGTLQPFDAHRSFYLYATGNYRYRGVRVQQIHIPNSALGIRQEPAGKVSIFQGLHSYGLDWFVLHI